MVERKERRKPQNSKFLEGFTLIELVIVVAIMSLLIFASLPTFRQFVTSSRLRQGCYDIISALRTAKSQAITERLEFATLVYTFQGLWSATQVYCTEDPDRGMITPWKRLPENIYLDTSSSSAESSQYYPGPISGDNTDTDTVVIFNSLGESVKLSGTVRNDSFLLRDYSTGDTAVIKVLGSTGRIYLFSFKGQMVQE